MKATLYMPYYGYDSDSFEANDSYYNSGNEYVSAVMNEYNRSSRDIDAFTNSLVRGEDGATYHFTDAFSKKTEDKVKYVPCECELFNDKGEESVDNLIECFARDKSFTDMFLFDMDSMDEDFESEINQWKSEHQKIDAYGVKMGEEWIWKNEPMKDLKMKFKNKANEDVCCLLQGCKIMDDSEKDSVIIFISKILLIDNI